ncbi:MAG: DUF1349 domain-containing protein [Chloroflexi bacterium]|nr:DUF1349 domain-containing protein [Chloroflexota bacterium]
MQNALECLTHDSLAPFRWAHAPAKWQKLADGGLRIYTPACVDYFQDPAGRHSADSAPYLWMPISGDLAVRAHIRHPFQSTYDAGAIMLRQDALHWAKLCFEATDFGTRAVVSVVTNGTSDDANGVDVTTSDIWLQLVRQGNLIAMHYAADGKRWHMVRLCCLALTAEAQIGLVAQCPVGQGAVIDWLSFEAVDRLPVDMRAGV